MPQPFDNFQPATALYLGEDAVALAEAARLAYSDAASIVQTALQWGFPRCRFIERRDTQGLVMANDRATLAAARWREKDKPVNGLYDFGAPRVGDRVFEHTFDQDSGARNFRFVNNTDLVTRVPLRAMGFSHAGTLLYFTDKGELTADPGWWDAFLNRMQGRIEDLGKMGQGRSEAARHRPLCRTVRKQSHRQALMRLP